MVIALVGGGGTSRLRRRARLSVRLIIVISVGCPRGRRAVSLAMYFFLYPIQTCSFFPIPFFIEKTKKRALPHRKGTVRREGAPSHTSAPRDGRRAEACGKKVVFVFVFFFIFPRTRTRRHPHPPKRERCTTLQHDRDVSLHHLRRGEALERYLFHKGVGGRQKIRPPAPLLLTLCLRAGLVRGSSNADQPTATRHAEPETRHGHGHAGDP